MRYLEFTRLEADYLLGQDVEIYIPKERKTFLDEFKHIETIYGENKRWTRQVNEVYEHINGGLIMLSYDAGLTESQESEFYSTYNDGNEEIRVPMVVKKEVVTHEYVVIDK